MGRSSCILLKALRIEQVHQSEARQQKITLLHHRVSRQTQTGPLETIQGHTLARRDWSLSSQANSLIVAEVLARISHKQCLRCCENLHSACFHQGVVMIHVKYSFLCHRLFYKICPRLLIVSVNIGSIQDNICHFICVLISGCSPSWLYGFTESAKPPDLANNRKRAIAHRNHLRRP